MKKILKDVTTAHDNLTYDNGRVLCIMSYLTYFGMSIGSLFTSRPWTAMDFAGGAAAMAVGFGVNFSLNKQKHKRKDAES